jgi:hypothetical protein
LLYPLSYEGLPVQATCLFRHGDRAGKVLRVGVRRGVTACRAGCRGAHPCCSSGVLVFVGSRRRCRRPAPDIDPRCRSVPHVTSSRTMVVPSLEGRGHDYHRPGHDAAIGRAGSDATVRTGHAAGGDVAVCDGARRRGRVLLASRYPSACRRGHPTAASGRFPGRTARLREAVVPMADDRLSSADAGVAIAAVAGRDPAARCRAGESGRSGRAATGPAVHAIDRPGAPRAAAGHRTLRAQPANPRQAGHDRPALPTRCDRGNAARGGSRAGGAVPGGSTPERRDGRQFAHPGLWGNRPTYLVVCRVSPAGRHGDPDPPVDRLRRRPGRRLPRERAGG